MANPRELRIPARDADIRARTARIAAICARYDVPLGAAALQFAASHPAVETV
jgi:D-threo-aldose 1-dehydrogenase